MSTNNDQNQGPNEVPQPIFFAKKQFDGTNSEIREHHYPDGRRLVVTRLGARKGGFSFEEAHEVAADAVQYHKELEEAGIPLPSIENIVVEYEPSIDRSVVVKSSPWAGHEVKALLHEKHHENDIEEIQKLVDEMLQIINCAGKKRTNGWEIETGIDPQCSNFIIDDEGVMRYVDLFPTRIRKEDGPIVEWPAPKTELGKDLGRFKHFDLRGIALTKSAQLARVKPMLKEFFEERVFEALKEISTKEEYQEFKAEIERTPWMQVRKILKEKAGEERTEKLAKIIAEALDARPFAIDYNIYTLREIALELAQKEIMSHEELENFFKASHFEDELDQKHLKALVDELLRIIQK